MKRKSSFVSDSLDTSWDDSVIIKIMGKKKHRDYSRMTPTSSQVDRRLSFPQWILMFLMKSRVRGQMIVTKRHTFQKRNLANSI